LLPAHEFLEKSFPICSRAAGAGTTGLIEERHKITLQRAAPAGRHHRSPEPVFSRREARPIGYLRREVGHGHTYTRHGTTTLFAALEVATGSITTAHYRRRRRVEFLDFMNRLVAAYPGRELHVVLDNLSTHKPKRERWLKQHLNVHFHFTPTYASWLNQVEIWFSKLARDALAGASFTSPRQIREQIDAYVARHNRHPKPFAWTAARVQQKTLKPRFRDL
jgi:transposase